ncbi:hypothetical protein D3C85_1037880 [compost metagenome]
MWASWYSDMLMVMTLRSPPYRVSASASAVSVLPTPLGPSNRNTPIGLFGSSMRAREILMRLPISCSAWSWPSTRSPSSAGRRCTVSISSRSILPSGMPVQPEITSPMVPPSTRACTSGCSPWTLASSARTAAISWVSGA